MTDRYSVRARFFFGNFRKRPTTEERRMTLGENSNSGKRKVCKRESASRKSTSARNDARCFVRCKFLKIISHCVTATLLRLARTHFYQGTTISGMISAVVAPLLSVLTSSLYIIFRGICRPKCILSLSLSLHSLSTPRSASGRAFLRCASLPKSYDR